MERYTLRQGILNSFTTDSQLIDHARKELPGTWSFHSDFGEKILGFDQNRPVYTACIKQAQTSLTARSWKKCHQMARRHLRLMIGTLMKGEALEFGPRILVTLPG